MEYDFSGWATRANVKCTDGRTIMPNAFKHNDGKTVPLVWNHQHNNPLNVLGHAYLENRDEGVYAYCKFNETQAGKNAKMQVEHGDITQLSIYANRLQQKGHDVFHGEIREVSLVLAGANPEAYIKDVIRHSDEDDEDVNGVIYYCGEDIVLCHADDEKEDDKEDSDVENEETLEDVFNTLTDKQQEAVRTMLNIAMEHSDDADEVEETEEAEETEATEGEDIQHADDGEDSDDKGKSVMDVYNDMTDEQRNAVDIMVGMALEDNDNSKEDNNMKHNVFNQDEVNNDGVLSHADQSDILTMAKMPGMTFQTALQAYADDNKLQHDAVSSGFTQDNVDGNITWLFPEYKDLRPGAPELITNDQGWVGTVMKKVHKSPISRIRTGQVDIRKIEELRAQGYQKGKQKGLTGNFKLVRRTTDPQTVYVKSALHRDDIIDITDFDYVQYLYNIDRMSLNEELATAIMLGDGRDDGAEGKIDPNHIRPIWTDDDLYTIHVELDKAKVALELQGEDTQTYFGDNFVTSEAMVNTVLYAREKFKGTGTPDMYITPHMLNVMLLARDRNGHRIYSSKAELATALNVGAIHTAEQFEGKIRTDNEGNEKKLLALIVNLADYSLGATKGGEISHFTDFDIDFNQHKSLLETRCSGALTRVYSAIAIEEPTTPKAQG